MVSDYLYKIFYHHYVIRDINTKNSCLADKFSVEIRAVSAGLQVKPLTTWMIALDASTSMLELHDSLAGRLFLAEDHKVDMDKNVGILSIVK